MLSPGRDMVGALGAEVDRLETEIQQVMPSIRHIDLVSMPSSLVSVLQRDLCQAYMFRHASSNIKGERGKDVTPRIHCAGDGQRAT